MRFGGDDLFDSLALDTELVLLLLLLLPLIQLQKPPPPLSCDELLPDLYEFDDLDRDDDDERPRPLTTHCQCMANIRQKTNNIFNNIIIITCVYLCYFCFVWF